MFDNSGLRSQNWKDNFDDCCECWLLNVASIIIFTIFCPFVLHHSSFCRHHRPTQDVALKRNQTCPICLCEIEQKNKSPVYDIPLVTPCCRRTWFHNKCLQVQKNPFFPIFFPIYNFHNLLPNSTFSSSCCCFFVWTSLIDKATKESLWFSNDPGRITHNRKKSICIWITVTCYRS